MTVSPAAVTRLVAALEGELGVRLLHRSTRRLALTGAGEQYLQRARAILSDLAEADALASNSSAQLGGRVRALIPPSFSFHQLVKHLPRFRAQYLGIGIDLSSAAAMEEADEDHDITVLLVRARLEKGEFVAHRLADTHVVLCASPGYLAAHDAPQRPADLAHCESLMVNSPAQPRVWALQRDSENSWRGPEQVQTPHNFLSAQHADTMFGAALAGLGIAALPSFVVQDALGRGTLVRVLEGWSLGRLTLYAAMPSRRYVPARTRAFMNFLIATFAAPGDPWLV